MVIPYVKHTSEKIAREFKKHAIDVVHKPSMTVKQMVCNMKDKVHDLDKTGTVYKVDCTKHGTEYIEETDRALKVRAYEHRVVEHKHSVISHSIKRPEQQNGKETSGTRRS